MTFAIIVSLIWIYSLWTGARFLKSSRTEYRQSGKELIVRALIAGLFFSPGLVILGYLVFPAPIWAFCLVAILGWQDIFSEINLYEVQYVLYWVVAPYLIVSVLFWLVFWARSRGKSV
ncbi:hypothetical protein Q672_10525 [Marinobacter sp. EVN1]|nr:hypothetical protein Q672_10525 [Marinobacter sp. EVN1]